MPNLGKLDKKFYIDTEGNLRKAKDDSVVPDDEWVVFLAQDKAFSRALLDYYHHCRVMEANPEQLDAIAALVGRVMAWQGTYPERCKTPDIDPDETLIS